MTDSRPEVVLPQAATDRAEHLKTLALVLDLVRQGRATTRSDLVSLSGLSRSVVTQRLGQLVDLRLVAEDGRLAPSTGGRSSRLLSFCGDSGRVLAIAAGATGVAVGVSDLSGRVIADREAALDINSGPDTVLTQIESLADDLLLTLGGPALWGLGVGLPGPVEFASGRPISPPIMAGWDGYDVRGRLTARYSAPVWVDNDVNVMALGEQRAGVGRGYDDMVFVKVGTGIGAGLISHGSIHRGAQGAAGDVGHVSVTDSSRVVCRCGNTGCLEAMAGGAAIARDAAEAVSEGRSPTLAALAAERGTLTAQEVAIAARRGDAVSARLLEHSGELVGEMLATLVSFFNPSLVVLGGGVAESGAAFQSAIQGVVYRRSLPLATRDLRIEVSTLGRMGGLLGAASMALDEIFTPNRLADWIVGGLPGGRSALSEGAHS